MLIDDMFILKVPKGTPTGSDILSACTKIHQIYTTYTASIRYYVLREGIWLHWYEYIGILSSFVPKYMTLS